MLTTRSTNCQPVMMNFVRPEAIKPINSTNAGIYYNPQKQTTIYMGGGGGNNPSRSTTKYNNNTSRRNEAGTIVPDTILD